MVDYRAMEISQVTGVGGPMPHAPSHINATSMSSGAAAAADECTNTYTDLNENYACLQSTYRVETRGRQLVLKKGILMITYDA